MIKKIVDNYKNRKYEVLPYDKNWVRLFDNEASRIKKIFGDYIIGIERVGSTAIPGMSGKPTIDILVLVNDISCADVLISGMENLGYEAKGEYIVAGGRLFVKEKDGHILFNAHIFQPEHDEAKKMLVVRNFLRKNKREALNYGCFKSQLFEKYPENYGIYRENKDQYFDKLAKRVTKKNKKFY